MGKAKSPLRGAILHVAFVSISRILSSLEKISGWITIYLVPQLPSGSSGTSHLRETRPCIQVRICSLHFHLSMKLFLAEFPCFRLGRFCSHLSDYSGRALPATLLPDFNIREMFGLSSPFAEAKRAITRYGGDIIIARKIKKHNRFKKTTTSPRRLGTPPKNRRRFNLSR